jgi:hypothetical protein
LANVGNQKIVDRRVYDVLQPFRLKQMTQRQRGDPIKSNAIRAKTVTEINAK